MDQASEYDTESDEEPEEDENVSAHESSQEVGGTNRELNFLFMAPRTRSGRISGRALVAIRGKSKASAIKLFSTP